MQRPPLERRFGEQNELVEVTKISSTDQILQRTEDQIVPKMVGQLKEEVPKMMSRNEIQRRTAEHIVDLPAPVFTERISARISGLSAFIEAAKTPSRCQNLQRTVEQDFVEVDKTTPQERMSERTGEQSRVIEVPKISCRGKCRGRQKYPSGANF